MSRERILENMAQHTKGLRVTGWTARSTSGWACNGSAAGHEPAADDLVTRTEAVMGAPSICKHCGYSIFWEPKQ